MKTLALGLALVACLTCSAYAQADVRITGFRVFVIWEDSGKMSPDWSRRQQIIANDRELGSAIQARVDVILEGPRGRMVDDTLELSVHTWGRGEAQVNSYSLPVGFFAKNRLIRSIIVTHDCSDFEVDANLRDSRRNLKVNLSCGD